MKELDKRASLSFLEFKRYENEIFLDFDKKIFDSQSFIAKDTLLNLGESEVHHLLKYYQKAILNSLFFNDKKYMLEYHVWLYRVYFYRGVDLDFFSYLASSVLEISKIYINDKKIQKLDETLAHVTSKHDELKKQASLKQVLIDYEQEATDFANLLISANEKKINEILQNQIKNLDEFVKFYDEIIRNAMKKIGFLWEIGEVSIAKEHLATSTLNDAIFKRLELFEQEKDKDKHIFLTSAPNELHTLGTKIATKILQKKGYRVTNMPSELPTHKIKNAILEFKPDLIVISASLQTSILDIAYLVDGINKDKMIFVKQPKIAIAGNAFEKFYNPTKVLNVDYYINNFKRLIELEI